MGAGDRDAFGLVAGPAADPKAYALVENFMAQWLQLRLLKNPIKGIYILLFLLMTLIIVFSATWFGLYLARGITEPIQMLAEGTREVAAGNLNYKVTVRADDEIGILVDSFNRMTGDLAASQSKLEETYKDLQAKHGEVEDRRVRVLQSAGLCQVGAGPFAVLLQQRTEDPHEPVPERWVVRLVTAPAAEVGERPLHVAPLALVGGEHGAGQQHVLRRVGQVQPLDVERPAGAQRLNPVAGSAPSPLDEPSASVRLDWPAW